MDGDTEDMWAPHRTTAINTTNGTMPHNDNHQDGPMDRAQNKSHSLDNCANDGYTHAYEGGGPPCARAHCPFNAMRHAISGLHTV